MEIEYIIRDEILIITPEANSLDVKTALDFKNSAIELIGIKNNFVIFDLNRLQHIDITGISCCLSLLRLVNSKDGELKLSCLSRTIRTTFELISLHKVFEIFDSTEDAIHSFKIKVSIK